MCQQYVKPQCLKSTRVLSQCEPLACCMAASACPAGGQCAAQAADGSGRGCPALSRTPEGGAAGATPRRTGPSPGTGTHFWEKRAVTGESTPTPQHPLEGPRVGPSTAPPHLSLWNGTCTLILKRQNHPEGLRRSSANPPAQKPEMPALALCPPLTTDSLWEAGRRAQLLALLPRGLR